MGAQHVKTCYKCMWNLISVSNIAVLFFFSFRLCPLTFFPSFSIQTASCTKLACSKLPHRVLKFYCSLSEFCQNSLSSPPAANQTPLYPIINKHLQQTMPCGLSAPCGILGEVLVMSVPGRALHLRDHPTLSWQENISLFPLSSSGTSSPLPRMHSRTPHAAFWTTWPWLPWQQWWRRHSSIADESLGFRHTLLSPPMLPVHVCNDD